MAKNSLPCSSPTNRVPTNKLVKPGSPGGSVTSEHGTKFLDYPLVFLKWALGATAWETAADYLPVSFAAEVESFFALLTWAHILVWFEPHQASVKKILTLYWIEFVATVEKLDVYIWVVRQWVVLQAYVLNFVGQITEKCQSSWTDFLACSRLRLDQAKKFVIDNTPESSAGAVKSVRGKMQAYWATIQENWNTAAVWEFVERFPKAVELSKEGITKVSSFGKIAWETLSEKSEDLKQTPVWNDAMTMSAFVVAGVGGYFKSAHEPTE